MPSRRAERMRTRVSSAMVFTVFTRSRRRSSLSAGIGRRMIFPSTIGWMPSLDSLIAFSMSCVVLASKGLMTNIRGSGVEMIASCLSFIIEP